LDRLLNVKQLREELPRIVERVRRGEKFTVLYRSRPAFRIVPVTGSSHEEIALEQDPMYRASAVGHSTDGLTSRDHDKLLYAKSSR
jgi:antitoxin (DNA-binding transcriptional repressor) of toxin-antitoxin stability system